MHDRLLTLMRQLVKLDEADQQQVLTLFRPLQRPKHTKLVEPGQVPRYLYFINQGFVRVYALCDGVEQTSHLNCPPGFITAFSSFIRQVPASEYVECVTDVELLAISRADLDTLYTQSVALAQFGRLIFEQSVAYNEQRTQELTSLSAEERYLKLLHQHPDIIQNVPLQYVASFIGIKPESLSRIRRKIIS